MTERDLVAELRDLACNCPQEHSHDDRECPQNIGEDAANHITAQEAELKDAWNQVQFWKEALHAATPEEHATIQEQRRTITAQEDIIRELREALTALLTWPRTEVEYQAAINTARHALNSSDAENAR